MPLPLDKTLKIGIQTIHRRTEPASAPWRPTINEMKELVGLVDRCGYDSLWVGDHVAFAVSILDPLLQLAQAAIVSRRLTLGTNVYLVPLRHPGPLAKQIASLDHLCEGRLIFGVGVGGEFPQEFAVSGVPLSERGARLSAAIPLLRELWSGQPVSHSSKYFGEFGEVAMQPPARQAGGPPIWCGGRADAALARTGRLADGWISYVVPRISTAPRWPRSTRPPSPPAARSSASAPGICCSRGSTAAMRPRSTPPPNRSASAMRWIFAGRQNATPRLGFPNRSPSASAISGMPGCGMW